VTIIIITLCTNDDNSFSERPECIELYDRNVLEKYVGYITHRINECIGKMQKFPMPYDESFNGNKDNYNYIASQRSVLKSIIECFVDLRVTLKFICSR